LVNFGQVRWDLIANILPTWVGMVFVVSFASCLDVAAISIDMGEALDTNRELATVGLCNCKSQVSSILFIFIWLCDKPWLLDSSHKRLSKMLQL
jgi:MFS superfamily sulfate permease-like transporter